MVQRLSVIVHDLDHVRAALTIASGAGIGARLTSPPGASAWLGGGVWAAMEQAARAAFPDASFDLVLDCADRPGDLLAALRAGCTAVQLDGPAAVRAELAAVAAQYGARLVDRELPRHDLGEADDPADYCRRLLRDETRDAR